MKRLSLTAFWCPLLVLLFGLFGQNCFAEAAIWTPGPAGTVYAYVNSPSSDPLNFGIDNLISGEKLGLFTTDKSCYALISFSESGGTWTASLNGGAGGTLQLGSSETFGFYFSNPDGSAASYTSSGAGTYYTLTSQNAIVSVADVSDPPAAPTPLPSPAVLFGSGLLMLIGFGVLRRRHDFRRTQTASSLQMI